MYSDSIDRAKRKINSLIDGENIIERKEYSKGLEALVDKDGLQVSIIAKFLGESARGYRTTYSLIDRSILSMENGAELFHNVIKPANVVYGHVLSDLNKQPTITTMLF